jgi:outer membrane lipoprotein carrier protein
MTRYGQHRSLFAAPLAVLVLAVPTAGASDSALAGYIQAFESSYRGVQTLRADFTQTYVEAGRTRIESGTVVLARGGRMRWEYRQPEVKVFVSDGKQMQLYIPAERQLTRTPLKQSEDYRLPLTLLLGHLNLRRIFSKVEFADQSSNAEPVNRILRCYPKPEFAEEYRQVLIELTPGFDIRRLVIEYPDSSTMQFVFEHIQRNIRVPTASFHFVPPPGTEVIQQ